MKRRGFLACVIVAVSACGGGGDSSPTPTTPTPQPQTNRAPTITSVTVTPGFGIAEIQAFNFAAIASDPDGDQLTYTWDLAGNPRSGQNASITFSAAGGSANGRGTVTVSDGKGGSATANADFTLGSATGLWRMIGPEVLNGSTYQLAQNATIVTGSFLIPTVGTGNADPAQPGTISAAGVLQLRCKVGPFTDYTINGTMDTTGRRITGNVTGSGFTGQTFILERQ